MLAWLFGLLCARAATYETRFFNQSLTHEQGDSRTFAQRYLVDDAHWGKGEFGQTKGCRGPVLFYTGNEGPIDEFWAVNGFMTERLAPMWGALIVFAEARYYGASLPFGNESFTSENAQYLTTELILADYAALIRDMGLAECPVVAFGGSYGGTLTTFFRATYPDVVIGGLAASAPIGYYDPARWAEFGVSADTWADVVYDVYDAEAGCTDAISAALEALRNADAAALASRFHVCDVSVLGQNRTELFQYALENLPQGDYADAWPVGRACAAFVAAASEDALVGAAADFTQASFGVSSGGACLAPLAEGPGGVPGDGPGDRSAWGYQSCTETLHAFSSHTRIRTYDFDYEAQAAVCLKLFGVRPDALKLTRDYGG
eukprot:CAMPEP_0184270286 /NCGR_PEP_ID=MMETSP0977-20130417/36820_1 /TAXON_ID=483370 /ORGANISM="non described non described, Strain CCMP2097" /LENGTH=374 /DNA_ID=CAMNT_0026576121 /DNA_START=48 /DNA_END=1168 /DNA_ORIENTATION=+